MSKALGALIVVALLTIAGCGGDDDDPAGLNPAFSGSWTGPTTMTFSDGNGASYVGNLVVAVSGNQATISNICLDGSQSVQANGTGNRVEWSGTLTCRPVAFLNCSAVTLTFQSAVGTLNGNALAIVASGRGLGCGLNLGMTVTFTGTK